MVGYFDVSPVAVEKKCAVGAPESVIRPGKAVWQGRQPMGALVLDIAVEWPVADQALYRDLAIPSER